MNRTTPRTAKTRSGATPSAAAPSAAAVAVFQPNAHLLACLLANLRDSIETVFVFVNGDVTEEVDRILAESTNTRIIRSPTNVGLGAALNQMLDLASAKGFEWILLLDQDSTPDQNLADRLLSRFLQLRSEGHKIAAIGPQLVPPPGSGYLPLSYSRPPPRPGLPVGAVDFVPTSGSLISLTAWRQIGRFREDFFIANIDVEWGFRAWHQGWVSLVTPDVTMPHRWGQEAESGLQRRLKYQILRHSSVRLYYYVRNTVATLRCGHVPSRWKYRQGLRLVAQLCLLLATRPPFGTESQLVLRAMRDGWRQRLGAAPSDVANPLTKQRQFATPVGSDVRS